MAKPITARKLMDEFARQQLRPFLLRLPEGEALSVVPSTGSQSLPSGLRGGFVAPKSVEDVGRFVREPAPRGVGRIETTVAAQLLQDLCRLEETDGRQVPGRAFQSMRFSGNCVGVPRIDGGLDRGQPQRTVDEKELDDLREPLRVSAEPSKRGLAFEGRRLQGATSSCSTTAQSSRGSSGLLT